MAPSQRGRAAASVRAIRRLDLKRKNEKRERERENRSLPTRITILLQDAAGFF